MHVCVFVIVFSLFLLYFFVVLLLLLLWLLCVDVCVCANLQVVSLHQHYKTMLVLEQSIKSNNNT